MGTKVKYLRYHVDACVGCPVLRGECYLLAGPKAAMGPKGKETDPKSLNHCMVWCGPCVLENQMNASPIC